jgi:Predicted endonuclease distantly related to archaeal Holliday junction resolvase
MKNANIYTGKEGEALALQYLQRHDYNILHCNWRYSRYETDIIAEKEGKVHFIEVKTRRGSAFGHPEESISAKKLKHMLRCAAAYQARYPGIRRIQFDVLSINLQPEGSPAYFLIEDVYL